MPIYAYACRACGHEFEEFVKQNAAAPPCPDCGGGELDRLISRPSIKSETTRDLGMRAARRRDQAMAAEKNAAQREYELNHDD